MTRCKLWRYVPDGGGDRMSLPGKDVHQWHPCRETALPGAPGCDACYTALIRCPNPEVRQALAEHPGTPVDVLAVLATDGTTRIAQTARRKLPPAEPAAVLLPLPTAKDTAHESTDPVHE